MAAMRASVSLESRRRWLQAWKSSGLIMTGLPSVSRQSAHISLSGASIPEIVEKFDRFQVLRRKMSQVRLTSVDPRL
jgi:hypothetical protein